jgi:hypothetical protein
VAFESLHGHHDDSSNKFADWLYKPHDQPAYICQKATPVRINLWLFQGQAPQECSAGRAHRSLVQVHARYGDYGCYGDAWQAVTFVATST